MATIRMYVLGWCLWGLGGCRCDERGRLRQNHCRAFGCTSFQMLIVPYVLYLAYIQYFSYTLGTYVRTYIVYYLFIYLFCSTLTMRVVWKCGSSSPSSGDCAGAAFPGAPGSGRAPGPRLRRARPCSDREAPAAAPRRPIQGHRRALLQNPG